MKCLLTIVFCLFVTQKSISLPIRNIPSNSLANIIEKSSLFLTDQKGFHPDLIQISIKKFKNDEDTSEMDINQEERQIPVISDIERIKKVIEIIEFVGEKVGDLFDKIQSTDPNEQIYDFKSSEMNTTDM
ncbi:unnamed protein product [Chironomus riparius]|uniref:Uncharacterized protein n=1 Tax=Chironomus riparius TaxID=315576 RepID=A0A9N9S3K3_9DIPT|nr:unnamed protein product [Chironomus riparius]